MQKSNKFFISIIIAAAAAVFIFITNGANIYTDWLWFQALTFERTFLIMFFSNFVLRSIIAVLFAGFIYINLHFTKKPIMNYVSIKEQSNVESLFGEERNQLTDWISRKRLNIIYIVTSVLFGYMFSAISSESWKMVLKFFNRTDFNSFDPIFNNDIGFYVFSLPFLKFLREMGMVLVIITLILVGIIYIIFTGSRSFNQISRKLTARSKKHLSILTFVFLLFKAWDYRLKMYELLFSARGVVFGAGYTDINATLLGYRILLVVVLLLAAAVLFSLFKKNYKLVLWGVGIWILTSVIFTGIYPTAVQQFSVEPNEISRERPYIENNINLTLEAYGLDEITTADFELSEAEISYEELMEYDTVIDNIRLWDSRPLLDTYSQLQELRQYYRFVDIDVDRYHFGDEYRQVMLAARELDQSALPAQAQTWLNKTLKYTHGFGLTMSPVSEIRDSGLPEFYIQDIPPRTNVEIDIDNTAIYYGEKTDNYVVVNTDETEFHYPRGDENVFIHYDGTGGVEVNNILRKGLFALRFNSMRLFLSDDIRNDSQVMFDRNIHQRVRKAAPFLKYDRDPYLVLDQGRLFWIYDAYTTSEQYPYSQPFNGQENYIRNSVKVVVDAYNGTMDYYIVDEDDPIVMTYDKIFSDLFTPFEEMPDSLRAHLRYPQDIFEIQSNIYATYHMRDPVVFYNREDLWDIPREHYAGTNIDMEPYYIMNNLPGEDSAEFILMTPFTPANRNNMVAWMAARMDGENYGELFAYQFPKDQLVYGPSQIESRIDQESEISQLLSLWDQRGSNVIRGNLLVIPINNNILYVEPVFLQSDSDALPELRRVIVAYKDRIIMRDNLTNALEAILDERDVISVPEEDVEEIEEETGQQILEDEDVEEEVEVDPDLLIPDAASSQLAEEANQLYQEAQQALRDGDFARYGELIEELGIKLEELLETGE
ncbi:UPF0182 family protein [Halanaerobium sp. Z-7514]|uniref:UPF0182 protein LJ207_05690 n=1 Tax=Halanaerobium polyolivorans TaxID=2886943 RepID=A0AAW4WUQ0_9FIRM|nr:UPF0182 family protein [Halanaerobium polyolivorans]MCC3144820.1 UPF0182 family protein [Halanaerobium polyolivorans]